MKKEWDNRGYVGLVYKKAIQKWKKGTTVLTI